jgi:hypothetical protein
VVGLVITMTIPFVMRYVLHFTMDLWSWLITGVGILLFVGSCIGMWYDNRKVKELIERLEMGEELEEEEDEEEGDDEDDEEEEEEE